MSHLFQSLSGFTNQLAKIKIAGILTPMLVDGRAIAEEIRMATATLIKEKNLKLKLRVITCEPNFETRKYLELKKKKAEALGVDLVVTELLPDTDTEGVLKEISSVIADSDGIIVQLPLPKTIDTKVVLDRVPDSHDVDAFSYNGERGAVLPPVVGAIAEIANRFDISWQDKKVVIFGNGRLVGNPAAAFARAEGATVTTLTVESEPEEVFDATINADIIILGVGKPGLLKPDMVKEGVVVFDAGASEDGGLLVGDADKEVASKASVFTPVPGGIGPITVALLYRNLLELKERQ